MNERYIIIAGGVMSGVGKGVATASIGKILQQYGFSATAIKIDPYINYDAGTLRPTEHGEVWVTDDGGEIDQDLGNYERFLGIEIPKRNNITTGQVYHAVIERERRGEYLGQTVQFIPHIPDEIKRRVRKAGAGFDFVLVEIGGTIGDYENIPFLFAMKSLEREIGEQNVLYVLLTYLPIPSHIEEMKTKPTQQAIKMLSEHGIFPDLILCRAKQPLDQVRKRKIETYANIDADYVISAPDVTTLYSVPLNFEKEGLGRKILFKFGIEPRKETDWSEWKRLVKRIEHPKEILDIAMVGKYVDIGDYRLTDSYLSVQEALIHAGAALDMGVRIHWVNAKDLEQNHKWDLSIEEFDGVVVPGGFGVTGVEGKVQAVALARERRIPFLGLCYGMQCAVVDHARSVCGWKDANSTEVDPSTSYPVIDIIPTQQQLLEQRRFGGTMRLGAYAAVLKENSQVHSLYRESKRLESDRKRVHEMAQSDELAYRLGASDYEGPVVLERHRHRYEVSPRFVERMEAEGIVFSGYHQRSDGTRLMEFLERPDHPFFIATQSHPEFKSSLENPAPLFVGFLRESMERHRVKQNRARGVGAYRR